MQHRDSIVLKKIMSEIDIAKDMMDGSSLEEFLNDEKLKRAVSMTVINIGELIKNLTDEFRNKYNGIPWKDIAGFRDVTAHKYQTLRMEDVYNTAVTELPDLKEQIEDMIGNDPEDKE